MSNDVLYTQEGGTYGFLGQMATQNKHAKDRHIFVNGEADLLEDQSAIKVGGLGK